MRLLRCASIDLLPCIEQCFSQAALSASRQIVGGCILNYGYSGRTVRWLCDQVPFAALSANEGTNQHKLFCQCCLLAHGDIKCIRYYAKVSQHDSVSRYLMFDRKLSNIQTLSSPTLRAEPVNVSQRLFAVGCFFWNWMIFCGKNTDCELSWKTIPSICQ